RYGAAGGRHGERSLRAHGECNRVAAGDRRGGGGGVHGEGEVLAGVGADPVGCSDRDRVAAAGARRAGAGQGGRPVAVVGGGDPARQVPGLGDRGGRAAGGGHRERPPRADGQGRGVTAGDRRGLLDGDGERLLDRAVRVRGRQRDGVRPGRGRGAGQ